MQNKNPLIVILGATATGKTALGISLARRFHGEIISADSRQIYKDLDIGSGRGKPHEPNIRIVDGVWVEEGIPIHLYNLFQPSIQVTVIEYQRLAEEVISDLHVQNRLPFVVGGTGFYISSLLGDTVIEDIPANPEFRAKAEKMELEDLVTELERVNPKVAEMTDLKNPRRVIRALERINYKKMNPNYRAPKPKKRNALQIGLTASPEELEHRIRLRTQQMIEDGFLEEARRLLHIYGPSAPALTAIGYQQFQDHLAGLGSLEEAIERKVQDEISYSKRQLTWFKRDPRITWFDVGEKDFREATEQQIPELVELYLKGTN